MTEPTLDRLAVAVKAMREYGISDTVLDQWEQSAAHDAEAGTSWSAHPAAVLTVMAVVRSAVAPSLIADAREVERLRAALRDAYDTMDAACRWAATQTHGLRTVGDADRHMAGYDALLDGTVRAGLAAGVLRSVAP